MSIIFSDINGIILDESIGVSDDDTTDALPSDFLDRLLELEGGPLTTYFPGDSGRLPEVAKKTGFLSADATGEITNLSFSDEDGDPLSGADSGLDVVGGGSILLTTDSDNDNIMLGYEAGTGELAFAAFIEESPNQDGSIDVTIWMVTFTAISHSDTSDPDDSVSILEDVLFISAAEQIDFDLSTLASGQNNWNWFGDTTDVPEGTSYQIIVNSDELGETVNTSKGGGDTTIGNSNQLMNGINLGKDADGEAMVFTFVKNSAGLLTGGDLGNVNTVNYSELQTANTGQWEISQTQGGSDYAVATMSAYLTEKETNANFFPGIADDSGTPPGVDVGIAITTVTIVGNGIEFTATDNGTDDVYTFDDRTVGKGKNADIFDVTVTFNADGSVEIVGLREKDVISYTTDLDHNRLILQNTGTAGETLPWDIGGFRLLDAGTVAIDVGPDMTIDDDGPTPGNSFLGSVQEDALNNANSIGIVEDGDTPVTSLSGTLGSVLPGTDGPATFSLVLPGDDPTAPTSKGESLDFEITGNATDGYTLTAKSEDTDRDVFVFTLDTDGSYTFVLKDQLDHDGDGDGDDEILTIDLTDFVTATDAEGDAADLPAGAVTVEIENDVPADNDATETARVDEDELGTGGDDDDGDASDGITDGDGDTDEVSGASVAGLLDSGADEALSWGFVSDGALTAALATLDGYGLKSKGDVVTWTIESGNVLTATADADGSPRVVLTVTLAADGGYSVDLDDQFDHGTGTASLFSGSGDAELLTLDLSALIAGTDYDGDAVTPDANSFKLEIENDVPADNDATETARVDEDELGTGGDDDDGDASDGITDGDGDTDEVSGASVAGLLDSGADEALSWGFVSDGALTAALATLDGYGLKSKGDVVTWTIESGNVLTATADADGSPRVVLTVTLAADGGYSVDLDDQFDHGTGTASLFSGSGDAELLTLDLSALIAGTDYDGDAVTPDANSFKLEIENDVPADNDATETARVDEDELGTGGDDDDGDASDGITDGDGDTDEVSGASVAGLLDSGADEALSWGFVSDGALTAALATLDGYGLKSKGDVVTWTIESGNVLTATADADGSPRVVLTVTLAADGGYSVDLDDQFDHGTGTASLFSGSGDAELLTLDLSALIAGTDYDGDAVTPDANSFKLEIENDVPADNDATETARVDEDELGTGGDDDDGDASDGITDGDGDTDEVSGASVAGLLDSGADEALSWGFVSDGALTAALATLDGYGLKSKGDVVTWTIESGNVLTATADADGSPRVVLTVTLAADGGYSVDLDDQFDHGTGTASLFSGSGDAELLTLDLSALIAGTDYDGDAVTPDANSFKLEIENDVPADNDATETARVDEDELGTGGDDDDGDASDGITDGDGDTDEVSGASVAGLLDSGADEALSWGFVSDGALTAALATLDGYGLKSKGDVVTWTIESGNVLTATADADGSPRVVLTVTLAADGGYSVDLDDQFDHGTGTASLFSGSGDAELLTLDLSALIAGTDYDGDAVTPDANSFKLEIENDVPTIGPIDDGFVEYDVTDSFTGDLNGTEGADETATYVFTDNNISYTTDGGTPAITGLTGIKDTDSRVVWFVDDDGVAGYSAGDTEHFEAVLNDDGTYTFSVLEPPNPAELNFSFDGFPSSNQIYGIFASEQDAGSSDGDALLVIPDGIVLNANGSRNNSGTSLNSSNAQNEGTALAVSNGEINPGEAIYFVSIEDPDPDSIVVGDPTFDAGNYKDGDTLGFDNVIGRSGASFEMAQTTPNDNFVTVEVRAYSYDSNPGDLPPDDYLEEPETNVTEVKIDTVTIFDGDGDVVGYWVWDGSDFVAADSPDDEDDLIDDIVVVTATSGSELGVIVDEVSDDYTIEWTQVEDAHIWHIENIDEGNDRFDIGGFNFSQSQPTPDQHFTAEVQIEDFDGDTAVDTFSVEVDGTGIFDDEPVPTV